MENWSYSSGKKVIWISRFKENCRGLYNSLHLEIYALIAFDCPLGTASSFPCTACVIMCITFNQHGTPVRQVTLTTSVMLYK